MRTTRSLFVALLCVFTALGAFAQSNNTTTGSVAGQVADASGAGLPGVTVTVANIDTGLTRNTVTENDGTYVVNLLPPGNYRVEAELAGLGKARVPKTVVLLGNTTKTNIKLTPAVSEVITVTAAAPIVDPNRSGTATSVTEQQIENLPILARDFRSLASLTPGVTSAFESAGLTDPKDFVRNAAKAVKAGLSADAALRAMTIGAAAIAGVADRLGSIERGKTANLIVTDGDLFDEKTKITRVFVEGRSIAIDLAASAPSGRGRGRGRGF